MMKNRSSVPEVNAGSMADIAFLLLIFFLVTASIENDVGLNRMLRSKDTIKTGEIKRRNLFEININEKDELLVNGEILPLRELREKVKSFIDNGGLSSDSKDFCGYCRGAGLLKSSENPKKAIIVIRTKRNTGYPIYVAVQNEVLGAYAELRDRESLKLFEQTFESMKLEHSDVSTSLLRKKILKDRIVEIQDMFPQKIIESEIVNH